MISFFNSEFLKVWFWPMQQSRSMARPSRADAAQVRDEARAWAGAQDGVVSVKH